MRHIIKKYDPDVVDMAMCFSQNKIDENSRKTDAFILKSMNGPRRCTKKIYQPIIQTSLLEVG